jgi:hypothetical protein
MNRERRLVAAVSFLRGFTGKTVVRSYARWFGVDLGCALLELQVLGVRVDPTYVDRVRATLREKERIGRQRNEQQREARAATGWCAEFEFEPLFDGLLEPRTGIPF